MEYILQVQKEIKRSLSEKKYILQVILNKHEENVYLQDNVNKCFIAYKFSSEANIIKKSTTPYAIQGSDPIV